MSDPNTVDVNLIMQKAVQAHAIFSLLDQEHTDRIVKAVYEAAFNNRVTLAKSAAEETGLGKWEDKVLKNILASLLLYNDIKDLKTVGVISEDKISGVTEIAQPLGPVLGVIPITNPTSTVIFKILICLKTRNPIIIKPSKLAEKCSIEAARICYEAALKEDAPEDCIQWVGQTSREVTAQLMSHKSLALILATGGGNLVKAAYSSGTPALGVGAGNVPVFIEKSADVPFAVDQILTSKTFDNGTVCASEQSIVVEKEIADSVIEEFKKRKAYFMSKEELEKFEDIAVDKKSGVMSTAVIGQPVSRLASLAGIPVPEDATLLIGMPEGVGDEYPISKEILAPALALYIADDFDGAIKTCVDINFHGGIGHTASIFSNDEEKIKQFSDMMTAGRIVVNMPSSQAAVGGLFNSLPVSLTLGCGTHGGNITTDNVTAKHLLNIHRVARRRVNTKFAALDKSILLDEGVDAAVAEKLYNLNS